MAEFFRCAVLEGNKRPTLRYTLAAARVLILAPLSASAQGALEGTIRHAGTGAVVAGARIGIPALNTQSAVPIDAITARDFIEQGDTGLSDLLRTVIPSFNVNPQAVGDAARIVRRGVGPVRQAAPPRVDHHVDRRRVRGCRPGTHISAIPATRSARWDPATGRRPSTAPTPSRAGRGAGRLGQLPGRRDQPYEHQGDGLQPGRPQRDPHPAARGCVSVDALDGGGNDGAWASSPFSAGSATTRVGSIRGTTVPIRANSWWTWRLPTR